MTTTTEDCGARGTVPCAPSDQPGGAGVSAPPGQDTPLAQFGPGGDFTREVMPSDVPTWKWPRRLWHGFWAWYHHRMLRFWVRRAIWIKDPWAPRMMVRHLCRVGRHCRRRAALEGEAK